MQTCRAHTSQYRSSHGQPREPLLHALSRPFSIVWFLGAGVAGHKCGYCAALRVRGNGLAAGVQKGMPRLPKKKTPPACAVTDYCPRTEWFRWGQPRCLRLSARRRTCSPAPRGQPLCRQIGSKGLSSPCRTPQEVSTVGCRLSGIHIRMMANQPGSSKGRATDGLSGGSWGGPE